MNVCVLGSNGQLGSDIVDLLKYDGFTGSEIRLERETKQYIWPDEMLASYDVIINTVAKHKPLENCESDVQAVTDVNVNFVFELGDWAIKNDATLIQISTDHCQDPKSLYALSKLWGEHVINQLVRTRGLKNYILRVAALHGPKGTNFIETICGLVEQRKELKIVDDQLTSFSHTKDVAYAIQSILGRAEYGLYNCAGIYEGLSFYEIAKMSVAGRGYLDANLIKPVPMNDLIRPLNTVMNSMPITKYYDMPTSRKAVIEYNERMMEDVNIRQ